MSKIRIAGIAAGLLFSSMAFAEAPAATADSPVPVDVAPPPPAPPAPPRAMAKPADQAQVEHMTDLVVQAVPFGRMFEMTAARDPKWPVQDNPGAVDATQLACLRSELSLEGYRRNKRGEVADYIAAHATRSGDEIRLLENGAATLMGKAMLAGAESGITGKEVDTAKVLGDATPEQFMAFISFINAPEYADLRKLAGIGDGINLADGAGENEKKGERIGANLAARFMLQAMSTCKVPMSALLK